MGSPAIFSGSFVKLLKSRIQMFNNWVLSTDQAQDPSSSATSHPIGSLFVRSGTNQIYKKFDSGSSTNWKLLDQPVPFNELDPLGDIDSMPDTTPLANTGGTLTLTTTGSEVGIGFQGIKFVASGTGEIVERDALTIPLGLRRAGQLGLKLLMKNNANWTVRLVDDTNAVNIIEETVNTADKWKMVEFSGPLILDASSCHWEIESTAADTVFISKASVTPDISLVTKDVTSMTDWESYTPTFASLTVGNGVSNARWRRVGDSIEINYQLEFGSTTSFSGAALGISPPSGLSLDTAKIATGANVAIGVAYLEDGSSGASPATAHAHASSSTNIRFLVSGSNVNNTVPFTWVTGDRFSCNVRAPIVGWSATSEQVVTNSDSVAPAIYETAAGQSIPNNTDTIVDFATKVIDNDALVTTGGSWKFTANKPMVVSVSAYVNFNASAANYTSQLQLYKNGALYRSSRIGTKMVDTDSDEVNIHINTDVSLAKNDYIDIRAFQNSGGALTLQTNATRNHVSIHRIDRTPLIANASKDTAYQMTVTGTNWTTTRATGVPYQLSDGSWRLRFNIRGTVNSASRTSYAVTITGVVFKNVSGFDQAITAYAGGSPTYSQGYLTSNTGILTYGHSSATTDYYVFSGDVELESKPTFVP